MQSYLAIAFALLTTTALAAPTYPSGTAAVQATLMGATPEDQATISVPLDSQFYFTNFGSSISHIQTTGGPCGFFGVDGLVLEVEAAKYVDVGPPQTIVGVACGAKPAGGWNN